MALPRITVVAPVTTAGMGDGWRDQHAAAVEFAAWLSSELDEKLHDQFPDYNIDVACPVLNQSGGGETRVFGDVEIDEDVLDRVRMEVRDIANELSEKWFGSEELTAHLVAE